MREGPCTQRLATLLRYLGHLLIRVAPFSPGSSSRSRVEASATTPHEAGKPARKPPIKLDLRFTPAGRRSKSAALEGTKAKVPRSKLYLAFCRATEPVPSMSRARALPRERSMAAFALA